MANTGPCHLHCACSQNVTQNSEYNFFFKFKTPSVCPLRPPHAAAADLLLLWDRRSGDIDRLLQQRRANTGSATLSAYVGSWTHNTDLLIVYLAFCSISHLVLLLWYNQIFMFFYTYLTLPSIVTSQEFRQEVRLRTTWPQERGKVWWSTYPIISNDTVRRLTVAYAHRNHCAPLMQYAVDKLTMLYLLFVINPIRVGKPSNVNVMTISVCVCMCLSFCLSVCLRAYLRNYSPSLSIFCDC